MNINETAVAIHKTAREHGFWDKERNLGEMLMLVASELAEALEEDRSGKPTIYWKCPTCGYEDQYHNSLPHNIPETGNVHRVLRYIGWNRPNVPCDERLLKPEGVLVEVIDAIIRLLDTAQHLADRVPFSIEWVMAQKMDYNDAREHMHGKGY